MRGTPCKPRLLVHRDVVEINSAAFAAAVLIRVECLDGTIDLLEEAA